ncbi:MAG: arginine deiminase [Treponema sp.]
MSCINVTSEIGVLKKIMLHRPSNELLLLTPDSLEELLFDDIPFLKVAQKEHDTFAKVLKDNGVEVLYLEDLVAEVIKDKDIKTAFINEYVEEAQISSNEYKELVKEYLHNIKDEKALVLKTMEGFRQKEIPASRLIDIVESGNDILIKPMPNLYFTRDPFACVGNGVSINTMYSTTRKRETLYGDYVFRYHKDYKGKVPFYYDRNSFPSIEGGDILNLTEKTIAVGLSQRTTAQAIDAFAKNIFAGENSVKNILVFRIPQKRAFMHLDTVFTQIDYDKFTIHPGILGPLCVYNIEKKSKGEIKLSECDTTLEKILGKYSTSDKVELIKCGGDDALVSEREQWNDGSNTLCIAPGKIVVYSRNEVTNEILNKKGLQVIELPDSELSRGRGGPRCMSMPFYRENLK